jgi:ABC-2 type transport system permease protein
MNQICPLFRREFLGYFRSPVAYVFLIVFLFASIGLPFFVSHFYDNNQASMQSYFFWHPWLFLFLIPAAGMRLWAEEKRTGTVELLFTLPITTLEAVLAKFLAAWAFLTLAILLSFPMLITLAWLGSPDWGVIAASYAGSILMAGAYLSVCSLTSALTKNQVISFVVSVIVCFVLILLGWSVFGSILGSVLPVWAVDVLSNFSFITHYEPIITGVIDLKDVVFFLSLTGFALFLNVVALER